VSNLITKRKVPESSEGGGDTPLKRFKTEDLNQQQMPVMMS